MKNYLSVLFILFCFPVLLKSQAELVKDINVGSGTSWTTASMPLAEFNDFLIFAARDEISNTELWRTDGTTDGTYMIKDVNPGVGNSHCESFFPTDSFVFFIASDNVHGSELWRTDGTSGGTFLVKDINPGPTGSMYFGQGDVFYLFNNMLFFRADDGVHGMELWRSDGTADGTVLVKDINSAPTWPIAGSYPEEFGSHEGKLYFQANGELWVTDGTEAGTTLVKKIGEILSSEPSDLISCNGYLLFRAASEIGNYELWRSDGTESGTEQVFDINPLPNKGGLNFLPSSGEIRFQKIGDVVYFAADDGVHGKELWRSDGTSVGTYMVRDASSEGNFGEPPQNFVIVDTILYYKFDDGETGLELWRSDGTESGTYLVKDVYPGPLGSFSLPTHIHAHQGKVFMGAESSDTIGVELWVSGGSDSTTNLLTEIVPGPTGGYPGPFYSLDTILLFVTYTTDFGGEMWRYFPPPQLITTVTGSLEVDCFGGLSDSIFIETAGGFPPYSYSWSDPSLVGPIVSGLPSGTYELSITDSNDNIQVNELTISQPDSLFVLVDISPEVGTSMSGSILISVSGGTGPYTFIWEDFMGVDSNFIDQLAAGVYKLTVQDANNCTSIMEITVGQIVSTFEENEVYPNPVSGSSISIKRLDPEDTTRFKIVSPRGLVWAEINYQYANGEYIIDLPDLDAGVYMLLIIDDSSGEIVSKVFISI
ncbi:MAG: T9SS type A sorting domain-containing protein [Saprospiraceae bacterium]